MTTDREALNLDALEAVARAATPGPWDHQPYGGQAEAVIEQVGVTLDSFGAHTARAQSAKRILAAYKTTTENGSTGD